MFEFQNFNTHSFSPHLAKVFGLKDSIFLQHIYYWLKHNKGKGKNFHDGNWWTYNTRKGFSEYFEYLTEDDIRGIVERLKKREVLITGNYNKSPYDKTAWYSLTEKGWQLFNDMIGEFPQSKGESTQSYGEVTKSNGEQSRSKGDKDDSRSDNSPTYTNSKTSIKQTSLSKIPKVRTLEECIAHAEKEKYSIDVSKFHKYWYGDPEDPPKRGMAKLMMSWASKPENQIIAKDITIQKSLKSEESAEVKKLREVIKGAICRDNEKGYLDHQELFAGKPIEKTSSGFVIKVDDERALKYQEVFRKIKVNIEVRNG